VLVSHAGTGCPFCSTTLPGVTKAVPSASQRLARGALFAFASTVAACGGNTAPEPIGDSGTSLDAKTNDTGATVKDSAPLGDGLVDDTGGPVAEYGAPPPDGSVDDSGDPMADYGAPPPPDAK
jgi:hypothetical protein